MKTPSKAEKELTAIKSTLDTVSRMTKAQEAVREKYKCSPYDQDFPMEKIKDTIGYKNVEAVKAIVQQADRNTPDFLSGILIPSYLVEDFLYALNGLYRSTLSDEKHKYCDKQSFQASQESVGATIAALLNIEK